jgi:hypothetical protein
MNPAGGTFIPCCTVSHPPADGAANCNMRRRAITGRIQANPQFTMRNTCLCGHFCFSVDVPQQLSPLWHTKCSPDLALDCESFGPPHDLDMWSGPGFISDRSLHWRILHRGRWVPPPVRVRVDGSTGCGRRSTNVPSRQQRQMRGFVGSDFADLFDRSILTAASCQTLRSPNSEDFQVQQSMAVGLRQLASIGVFFQNPRSDDGFNGRQKRLFSPGNSPRVVSPPFCTSNWVWQ